MRRRREKRWQKEISKEDILRRHPLWIFSKPEEVYSSMLYSPWILRGAVHPAPYSCHLENEESRFKASPRCGPRRRVENLGKGGLFTHEHSSLSIPHLSRTFPLNLRAKADIPLGADCSSRRSTADRKPLLTLKS